MQGRGRELHMKLCDDMHPVVIAGVVMVMLRPLILSSAFFAIFEGSAGLSPISPEGFNKYINSSLHFL